MVFSLVEVVECNIYLRFSWVCLAPVTGQAVPCLRCCDFSQDKLGMQIMYIIICKVN